MLLKDDIPLYLSRSPYLEALITNEDFPAAGIEVPADCCKANTRVLNVSDLEHLLKTVRYWLVPELLPDLEELHVFSLDPKHGEKVTQVLNNFKKELPHVSKLLLLVSGSIEEKLIFAAGRGFLSLLESLHGTYKDRIDDWDSILCSAAKEGHLSCLQYIYNNGWPFGAGVACAAAENGRTDCLLHILNKLVSEGSDIPAGDLFAAASKGGQVSILKYLLETLEVPEEDYLHQICWSFAASGGHVKAMEYLCELKFECDKRFTFIASVEGGHIAALEYLISKFGVPDQDEADELWVKSASTGQLQMMMFLQEHVAPRTFTETVEEPSESIMHMAIMPGGLLCVAYLHELGHPWHKHFTHCAAEYGLEDIFRFLVDNGCPYDSECCTNLFAKDRSIDEF